MIDPPMRRPVLLLLAAVTATVVVHAQPAPSTVSSALLITGGTVVTMDPLHRVLSPGAVAIKGRDIVAVGTPRDAARAVPGAQVIDATGRIVMPGLVNTHTHAPMVMYRGSLTTSR